MSSSKRRQSPYGEAVSQGRCCTNSACSRKGRQSFETLLQSDVFPPPCEGNRRKTESSQELGTDVVLVWNSPRREGVLPAGDTGELERDVVSGGRVAGSACISRG